MKSTLFPYLWCTAWNSNWTFKSKIIFIWLPANGELRWGRVTRCLVRFLFKYQRAPGLIFSAQNDERVGLQWQDFLRTCSSKLLRFLSCIGLPKGVKSCESEGVKDKLNPHSYIFFGQPRGVKRCKSSGVISLLPSHSYTILPPFADWKSCKSGGLICLLPPHSYTILPHMEAQCSPNRCKSFELHFPEDSSHCGPTPTSFYPPPPWQPNSYIILYPRQPNSYIILPPQSYIVLAPIPEDFQSWTHNLCTLSCVALSSRPSKLVQLLTVYIYE